MYRAKQAAIQDSEENARGKFGRFLFHASQLMEREQVDLPSLKLTWKGLKGKISEEACQSGDIVSFLMAISKSQGPYAYRDLSDLLTLFCGEGGKEIVEEYEKELKLLLNNRVMPIQANGKRFKVLVDKELSETNESDFRITLARLFKCTTKDFLLEDIRDIKSPIPRTQPLSKKHFETAITMISREQLWCVYTACISCL